MRILRTGYTLVEMVVVVGITGLLVVALTVFIGRSFGVSREQFEQVRITEDARLEIERISDTLRNARFVDLNGNGVTDESGEHWLLSGDSFDVSVYTNVDDDTEAELVRYAVDAADPRVLTRTVRQAPFTGEATTEVLMRTLFNYEQAEPIFTFFAGNGSQLPTPVAAVNRAATARIQINFIVDANPAQRPAAAVITTDVSPRSSACAAGNCQGVGNGCLPKSGTALGPYDYSSNSFVEDGGQACRTYCQTAGATATCPWYSTYAWDGGSSVSAYCSCITPTYPSPLPDTVAYGQYTPYYKDKWEYCNTLGQYGSVVCDPGLDFDPTGQCTYECQAP